MPGSRWKQKRHLLANGIIHIELEAARTLSFQRPVYFVHKPSQAGQEENQRNTRESI